MSYAEALAEQPGKMIPELFTRKYDINATYDLLDEREVVPDAIQAAHRRLVMAELRKSGRYLLIEDTTFPSFSHRKEPIPGLGPIGDSEPGQQGFLLHSILAVRASSSPVPDASGRRPPVTILGLADQQYLIRTPRDPDTPKQAGSRQRQIRDRESDRWLQSGKRIGRAPNNPEVRWARVADREADIYEYMDSCRKAGHGFVIRVSQNRILLNPADGKRLGLVFEHIAGASPLGGIYLDLRGRDGQVSAASEAPDQLWSGASSSPRACRPCGGAGEPIDCWFVRIWEQDPPEGVEPLEWVLYTDRPTESRESQDIPVYNLAICNGFPKGAGQHWLCSLAPTRLKTETMAVLADARRRRTKSKALSIERTRSVQEARFHAERGNEDLKLLVFAIVNANSTVLELTRRIPVFNRTSCGSDCLERDRFFL